MAQWASLSPSLFLSLLATTQQFTHPHIISLHVNSFEEEKARALAIVEAVAHSGGGKNDINIGEKELNDPTSEDCIFNYFPLEHLKVLLSREKSFSTPSMEKFFFIECEVHFLEFVEWAMRNLISFRPIILLHRSPRARVRRIVVVKLSSWTQREMYKRGEEWSENPSTPRRRRARKEISSTFLISLVVFFISK